jgi:chromosome segregation protein
LLRLRKVEILGFKSFCERTTVTFSGEGITAIVGPNGCGKSNVVDAISWVLGEQSHKSLRAERMADCIFNGTAKRPPLGLAEVSITLVDPELAAAADFVLNGKSEEMAFTAEVAEVAEAENVEAGFSPAASTEGADADLKVGSPLEEAKAVESAESADSVDGKKRRRKQPAPPTGGCTAPGKANT